MASGVFHKGTTFSQFDFFSKESGKISKKCHSSDIKVSTLCVDIACRHPDIAFINACVVGGGIGGGILGTPAAGVGAIPGAAIGMTVGLSVGTIIVSVKNSYKKGYCTIL